MLLVATWGVMYKLQRLVCGLLIGNLLLLLNPLKVVEASLFYRYHLESFSSELAELVVRHY